jgi:hypothetical protein
MEYYWHLFKLIPLIAMFLAGPTRAGIEAGCEFQIEPGESPMRMLTLTGSVYACMRQSNYRDMHIKNGDGNSVPFRIVHPSARKELVDYRKPLNFNIDTVNTGDRYHQHLRRLVRSTSYLHNHAGFEIWNRQHTYLTSIIVENPDTEGDLNRIHIELDKQRGETVSATVYLEYSNDLSRWTSSSQPQKLFYMNADVNGFQRRQLKLGANRRWRYLRIVVLSNIDLFVESIDRLEGIYQRARFIDPEYVWVEATSIQQLNNGQDWQFSVPDQLPVSRLRFKPGNGIVYYSGLLMSKPIENEVPEDNAYLGLRESKKKKVKQALKRIVRGKNRSFESANSGWRKVTRFQQLHFESTGESAQPTIAEPIFFPHKASRHWRITFDHPSSEMIASQFPVVEFGWTAARVRFLAQGPGPFVLQAGLSGDTPRPTIPDILHSWSENLEQVGLFQTAESRATPAQSELIGSRPGQQNGTWQVNGRTMIWAILIAGVLVMAYMAWQLMRSIENKAREEDE